MEIMQAVAVLVSAGCVVFCALQWRRIAAQRAEDEALRETKYLELQAKYAKLSEAQKESILSRIDALRAWVNECRELRDMREKMRDERILNLEKVIEVRLKIST